MHDGNGGTDRKGKQLRRIQCISGIYTETWQRMGIMIEYTIAWNAETINTTNDIYIYIYILSTTIA